MNNKKTNKMPGVEHTYGGNNPSESEKDRHFRENDVIHYKLGEDATRDVISEKKDETGRVVSQEIMGWHAPTNPVQKETTKKGITIEVHWEEEQGMYVLELTKEGVGYYFNTALTNRGNSAHEAFKRASHLAEEGLSIHKIFNILANEYGRVKTELFEIDTDSGEKIEALIRDSGVDRHEGESSKMFHTEVNGLEMFVSFYGDTQGYELYIPKLDKIPHEERGDIGSDTTIYIGSNLEKAKKVFVKAVKLAAKNSDPIKLYQEIESSLKE